MDNDLRNFRPAYLKLQADIERLNCAFKPSYMDFYEQIGRALEPIRQYHTEISKSLEISGLTSSRLSEIVQANQHWQALIDQATASSRVFENFKWLHQTWLEKIKPMEDNILQLQATAKLFLSDVAYKATLAEHLFAGIDFDVMRRAIVSHEPAFQKLQDVVSKMTATYENLAASIQVLPNLTYLSSFALPGATREIFITGYALDTIYVPKEPEAERDTSIVQLIAEVERETSGCIGLLQAVDPALARPYIGAHDALRGRNADRTRHILSSLKELWNHLLRRLAPDEHVLSWVPTDDKDLLHEGRPTRRARVLYICRSLNHGPLTDFVVQDTRALVKLVEFFNRVHDLEPKLTDEQLRALLLRTDSWLTYILQIWEETR
jgi:hypothetical protein